MISGIMTRLLATTGVTDLVQTKIYPVVAEQETQRPYVTIRRTGVSPAIVKNETSGKDEVNFNVAAYAKTYKECIDILAAIRTSLDNFRGDSNSITFLNVWYAVSEDLFDKADETYIVVDTYSARIKR
jgi:hypothetical protein